MDRHRKGAAKCETMSTAAQTAAVRRFGLLMCKEFSLLEASNTTLQLSLLLYPCKAARCSLPRAVGAIQPPWPRASALSASHYTVPSAPGTHHVSMFQWVTAQIYLAWSYKNPSPPSRRKLLRLLKLHRRAQSHTSSEPAQIHRGYTRMHT